MPGTVVHVGAVVTCPHFGQVQVVPGNPRVTVATMPVATMADTYPVLGCPFQPPSPPPQLCTRVQWLAPATRVLVNGAPPILNTSGGLCLSPTQVPNGPPAVVSTQPRVVAT